MSEVFNLTKDVPFSLEKVDAGAKDWYIGLDWDPAVSGNDIDLDAVLIAVGPDGQVIDGKHSECFLFYNNNGRDGKAPHAFEITEDNQDGSDDFNADIEDDEAMFVYGDKITEEFGDSVTELRIFVTFHEANGRTLEDVSRVGLRIAPLKNGAPDGSQAKFDVRNAGACEGAYMARLVRKPGNRWDVVAVGEQIGNLAQIATAHGIGTKG